MQSARIQPSWNVAKPIVGMVHLLPLPGAPGFGGSVSGIIERAVQHASVLVGGGVNGLLIENYGDSPFFADDLPAATISALTLAVAAVRSAVAVPVGVNALRNDAAGALSIAACTGAQFVRVNVHTGAMLSDQGWLTGRAAETLRLRSALGAPVAIFADVLVKHAVAPVGLTLENAASDTWERGRADALILSGEATGRPTDIEQVRRVARLLPEAPLWVGSGVTEANVVQLLNFADGVIVGSAFQRESRAGGEVVPEQVRRLVDVARRVHS